MCDFNFGVKKFNRNVKNKGKKRSRSACSLLIMLIYGNKSWGYIAEITEGCSLGLGLVDGVLLRGLLRPLDVDIRSSFCKESACWWFVKRGSEGEKEKATCVKALRWRNVVRARIFKASFLWKDWLHSTRRFGIPLGWLAAMFIALLDRLLSIIPVDYCLLLLLNWVCFHFSSLHNHSFFLCKASSFLQMNNSRSLTLWKLDR